MVIEDMLANLLQEDSNQDQTSMAIINTKERCGMI